MAPFLKPASKEHLFQRNPHSQPDYSHPGAAPEKEELDNEAETEAMEAMIKSFLQAYERKDYKVMAVLLKLAHDVLHEYMDKKE